MGNVLGKTKLDFPKLGIRPTCVLHAYYMPTTYLLHASYTDRTRQQLFQERHRILAHSKRPFLKGNISLRELLKVS